MSIDKNFVIKNGLEVDSGTLMLTQIQIQLELEPQIQIIH